MNGQITNSEVIMDVKKRLAIPEELVIEYYQDETISGFSVVKSDCRIEIHFSEFSYLLRALGIISEHMDRANFNISQSPDFKFNGLMIDCSRNAVSNITTIKDLIVKMALMGHTMLMLYTEDTYEVEGHPYFGYMRGKYTVNELNELDAFAASYGIELIPCIQTLAHLNCLLQWDEYRDICDCADILLADNDKTYSLIEDMIRSCRKSFSTKRIHIGMDEAWLLGRGKYRDIHGDTNGFEIMCRHLQKVISICNKYNFEPMIWSDMFYHLLTGSSYQQELKLTEEQQKMVPEQIGLVYWDYYSASREAYAEKIEQHLKLERDVLFAGGAWKWAGYAPLLYHSMKVSKEALDACRGKIDKVFATAWGDNGGEASIYSILPVVQLFAEYSFNKEISDEELSTRFKTCTGGNIEDFYCLDLPNIPEENVRDRGNPHKYLLFQDIMTGLFDRHVSEKFPRYYKETSQKLLECAERNVEYAYVFETLAALCDVLELKCDIGVRIKAAYDSGEKDKLLQYAEYDLKEVAERTIKFKKKLEYQWMHDNKPFGFEVQDVRVGGVITRALTSAQRIKDYVSGDIKCLEELEEERLYFDCRKGDGQKSISCNLWEKIFSASAATGV